MAGDKYLKHSAGLLAEQAAIQASAGAADAGKIPALDANGKFDNSMMPVGVAAETAVVTASEALGAGNLVNIWDSGGLFRARKADASAAGKEAHAFVLAAVGNGAAATVYYPGQANTQVVGAAPGMQYLSDVTPGGIVAAPPVGAGKVVQRVGFAVSATEIIFDPESPIVLA